MTNTNHQIRLVRERPDIDPDVAEQFEVLGLSVDRALESLVQFRAVFPGWENHPARVVANILGPHWTVGVSLWGRDFIATQQFFTAPDPDSDVAACVEALLNDPEVRHSFRGNVTRAISEARQYRADAARTLAAARSGDPAERHFVPMPAALFFRYKTPESVVTSLYNRLLRRRGLAFRGERLEDMVLCATGH